MPQYDIQVTDQATNWLNEFGYGYRLSGATSESNRIVGHLSFFEPQDVRYANGTRDAPGPRTLARLAIATAIRQVMQGRRDSSTLYAWFDQDPGPLNEASAVARFEMPGYDQHPDPVQVVIARSVSTAHQRTAHWEWASRSPRGRFEAPTANSQIQRALDGDTMAGLPAGLVYEPADPGNGYIGTVRPTDELLATLSERARPYATLTVPNPIGTQSATRFMWEMDDNGNVSLMTLEHPLRDMSTITTTGEQLVERARESYRVWLRLRWNRAQDNRETERIAAMERHRVQSARNFSTFRQTRTKRDEEVIPTLPFLPHGLASSRRWGIEIESGGCRGVAAPEAGRTGWRRKTDGSLRSAWNGYREVQDFEPYDEEVTDNLSWYECANYENHMPHQQYFDADRNEHAFRVNDAYIPVSECTECGNRTRTVRREPQTIVHQGQSDDCGEFVSPILVSMHSNGLQTLLAQIAPQPQNATAGVHVHVEANDLTDKQIATLVYGYDLIEPIIEASYRREERRFCKRRTESEVLEMARAVKRGTAQNVRGGDRYVTVNTNSLSVHGTIEFRAMGPVYSYDYLIRWAMFCREMVNVVAAGATQKDFGRIKKWEDVLVLFAKFGKEYLRAAVYEMTGETGEQAALSKAGQPITNEAANADFAAVVERITTGMEGVDDAFRRLARSVAPATAQIADFATITSRLAVSDRLMTTV